MNHDMKTINLFVSGEGWKAFQYEKLSDLKEEFDKRGIWISGNASVGDHASVGDNASVGYYARVGDHARVGDYARVGDCASVGDYARVGDYASVGYNASVGDHASVGYHARVEENTHVKSIFITASKNTINYWGEDKIQIGCQSHSISVWKEKFKSIGEKHGYTSEQIEEYKSHIDMIALMHESGILKPVKID